MNRTQLEHIIRAASRISGDSEINQALMRYRCVDQQTLLERAETLPVDAEMKKTIAGRIRGNFAATRTNPDIVASPSRPSSS
jgi:hypothetical protein